MRTFLPIMDKSGFWGYIDSKGNLRTEMKYGWCGQFFDGFAVVGLDGAPCIMDKDLSLHWQSCLDDIDSVEDMFCVGRMKNEVYILDMAEGTKFAVPHTDELTNIGRGLFIREANDRFGIIRSDGRAVIDPVFEEYPDVIEVGRLIVGKRDGYCALYDWNLNLLHRYECDRLDTFYDDRAVFWKDGMCGVMNLDGSLHVPLGSLRFVCRLDPLRNLWCAKNENGYVGVVNVNTGTTHWTHYQEIIPFPEFPGYWLYDGASWSVSDACFSLIRARYCDDIDVQVGDFRLVHRTGHDSWYVRAERGELVELHIR